MKNGYLCPVCGSQREDECPKCGWIRDDFAEEMKNEVSYDNLLTLEQAIGCYEQFGRVKSRLKKVKKDYSDTMCPVCGKTKFNHYNSDEICPVCRWTNDGYSRAYPDEWGGENSVSLNRARENYAKYGNFYGKGYE